MFFTNENSKRVGATLLVAALLASGGVYAASQNAPDEAVAKLEAIEAELNSAPATEEGLATIESLKRKLRKIATPTDEASLKWAKLHTQLNTRAIQISEAIEKGACDKVMAGSGLPADQMDQRVAVPYDQVTLGDFICAAKMAGAFVEYSEPSFFDSAYTVRTHTITLEFQERTSAGGSILVLNAFETSQGRAKPADDREAMLATFEAYAAFKNAGN